MAPIRKGDGTPLEIPGVSEVRAGDGRVFFDGDAIPDSGVVYEDFEWGGSMSDRYDEDYIEGSGFEPIQDSTIEGDFLAEIQATDRSFAVADADAMPDSDLGEPRTTQIGDAYVFSVYSTDATSTRPSFHIHVDSDGSEFDSYVLSINMNDSELLLGKANGDDVEDGARSENLSQLDATSFSYSTGTVYSGLIRHTTDGDLEGNLYEGGYDPENPPDSPDASVSVSNEDDYTSGDFAWGEGRGSSDTDTFVDDARLIERDG